MRRSFRMRGRAGGLNLTALGMCLACASARASYVVEPQSFNSSAAAAAAGWAGSGNGTAGNHAANTQNYGWSNTSNAGGAQGEAGGDFYYTSTVTYYADTTLNGTINLTNGALAAGGRIAFPATAGGAQAIFLGYFNPSTLTSSNVAPSNFLGVRISDNNGNGIRINSMVDYSNGGNDSASTDVAVSAANALQIASFGFTYTRGAPFTVTFFNSSNSPVASVTTNGNTTTSPVFNANLTAFGMATVQGPFSSANPIVMFVDDLNYNVIPEPASATALGLVGIAMVAARRKR